MPSDKLPKIAQDIGNSELKLSTAKMKIPRSYFDRNCSADYAAAQTGISRKTVQKYWRIWSAKLIEEMDSDFIKMQKEAKGRGLSALSERINDITEIIDQLKMLNNAQMKREKALLDKDHTHEVEVNKWLIDKISKLSKDIFNMEQIKVQIQMKPSADINLQLQIDQMLSKARKEINTSRNRNRV